MIIPDRRAEGSPEGWGGGAEFLGAFLIQALGGTGGIRGGIAAALLGEKKLCG